MSDSIREEVILNEILFDGEQDESLPFRLSYDVHTIHEALFLLSRVSKHVSTVLEQWLLFHTWLTEFDVVPHGERSRLSDIRGRLEESRIRSIRERVHQFEEECIY